MHQFLKNLRFSPKNRIFQNIVINANIFVGFSCIRLYFCSDFESSTVEFVFLFKYTNTLTEAHRRTLGVVTRSRVTHFNSTWSRKIQVGRYERSSPKQLQQTFALEFEVKCTHPRVHTQTHTQTHTAFTGYEDSKFSKSTGTAGTKTYITPQNQIVNIRYSKAAV